MWDKVHEQQADSQGEPVSDAELQKRLEQRVDTEQAKEYSRTGTGLVLDLPCAVQSASCWRLSHTNPQVCDLLQALAGDREAGTAVQLRQGAVCTLLGTKAACSPWLQDVEAATAVLVAPSAIPCLPVGSTMQHPQLHASLHRKAENEGPLEVAQTPGAALCMMLGGSQGWPAS